MEDNKLRIEASLDMEEEMRKVDRSAGRLLFSAQMIQHPKYTNRSRIRPTVLSLFAPVSLCVCGLDRWDVVGSTVYILEKSNDWIRGENRRKPY